jgi:hypothetical protein
VGNQADNIWGTLIFSTPMVYNGIFGMDIIAVRIGLIASPFIYPAIRLVQAFIATLIAIPIVRILQNTKWFWSNDHLFADKQLSNV